MVRGLMWLPLLAIFIGLAWAGWNEYRKLEAYKVWAQPFERAKYDIYAALGQQGDVLTWGIPSRQGVLEASSLNLTEVKKAVMEVNAKPANPADLPSKGRFSLGFTLADGRHLRIPFVDGEMAAQWLAFFKKTMGFA